MTTKSIYNFKYTNKCSFTMEELGASLISQAMAAQIAKEVLNEYFKNDTELILSLKLNLKDIKGGSADNNFTPQIDAGVQTKMFDALENVIIAKGVQQDWAILLAGLVVCIGLVATLLLIKKLATDETQKVIIINNSFNGIAESLNLDATNLQSIINASLGKKQNKDIAKMVKDLFAPAKKDGGAPILSNGKELLSKETVNAIPIYLEAVEDDVKYVTFINQPIRIVATDLEKRNQGWAARIIGGDHDGQRVVLIVGAEINLEKVAHLENVHADFTLELINKKGEFKPIRIHLIKIHKEIN